MASAKRIALAFLFSAAVAGCKPAARQANEAGPANAAAPVENFAAKVPLPQPPMDRAALLEAVAEARSAAAAGLDDRQAQQALDGKEFELRIRFGCAGPTKDVSKGPSLGWSLDPKSGVLRVRAAPDLSSDDPAIAAMRLQGVEAVEGFWLARPWLLQAACPANPLPAVKQAENSAAQPSSNPDQLAQPAPPAADAAKVGIAQFFTPSDPRSARRDDRPYSAVKQLELPSTVGSQGFDLVVSGRLRALGDGRVIRCVAQSADSPPDCVIAALFDHVWIDDVANKQRIADWSSS